MTPTTILFLIPLITSIVDDVMESFDPTALADAIREYKDLNSTSTDEAQQELAKKFDAAFDWKEALEGAGVGAAFIGEILEYLDYRIWYMAIKVYCKCSSRKRKAMLRRFNARISPLLDEYRE